MKLKQGMREKKNGSIEYRITIDGKRYSITAKSVKEVLAKEQQLRVDVATKSYKKNGNVNFDSYFEEWIKRKESTVKPSSIHNYRLYYDKWIRSALGEVKIADAERRQLINFQMDVKEKKSPECANYCMAIVKMILTEAVRDEIIQKSPADSIQKFKTEKERAADTNHRALTLEEQDAFFEEAKHFWLYDALAFQIMTGMRAGEVCALLWSDIDKKNEVIHITKTVTVDENGNYTVSKPKTDSGERDIPLTKDILKIIEMNKEKTTAKFPIGIHTNVFVSFRGNNLVPARINSVISSILSSLSEKGIKIDHFSSHALRDTFATRFIEQGGNMKTLQTLLGHSSIQMTMDLYAHVLPDTKKKEMSALKIKV